YAEVMSPGVVVSGTDQRWGARGAVRFLPDSKLQLFGNEFLVRDGSLRFDDAHKLVPKLNLRAQTEYRRYVASTGSEQPTTSAATASEGRGAPGAAASPVSAAASTSAAGVWRITIQLLGELDKLDHKLTSDPPLSEEDLLALLTIGMTRTELDRS